MGLALFRLAGLEVGRIHPESLHVRRLAAHHVKSPLSVDFFAVPTIRFQILHVLLVLAVVRKNSIRASCCHLFQPVFVVQATENRSAANIMTCR